jgi:predicted metal-binding membrane protein
LYPPQQREVVAYRLRLRDFGWKRPEWWIVGASLIAWALLLGSSELKFGFGQPQQHSHAQTSIWADWSSNWLLMVVAMMLPLAITPISRTATRSLWNRRHRAIAGFLIGYLTPWAAVGILLGALMTLLPIARLCVGVVGAALFASAGIWELLPSKRRALRECHRTLPLAPRGYRADRDCIRFGCLIGRSCLQSCGPLMLACMLGGHSIATMAYVFGIGAIERYSIRTYDRRFTAATLMMVSGKLATGF